MGSFHSIVNIMLGSLGHLADGCLISRIYSVKRVTISGIHKLIVDEQLIGEADVHVIHV